MSDLTNVRKTLANEVREQEKRAARQAKAYVRSEDSDVNKPVRKDSGQRPQRADGKRTDGATHTAHAQQASGRISKRH